MRIVFKTLFLLFAVNANAGGWVSSGGELFKDVHNPWFVKNTDKVSYCIQLADKSMSVTKQVASKIIVDVIQYWKNEFSKGGAFTLPTKGFFQLGTQTFQEVDCSTGTPDIRFLLGYETLSQAERDYLQDPQKYIGVSVRTDYDEVNLKGKGFVFVSSDIGPYAYHNSGNLIEHAWTNQKLLTYVLLHEMGHVFGFPHMGTGLMSEVFLEQLLNKSLVDNFLKWKIETFLQPDTELELCTDTTLGLNMTWFAADPSHTCIVINGRPGDDSWNVYSKKDHNSPTVLVGNLKGLSPRVEDLQGHPAVTLQLTDKQTPFTPSETAFRSFMIGPVLMDYGISANYVVAATKEPKSVYIKINPTLFEIIANSGKNKIEPVYTYNSPLSLLLLISPTP